MAYILSSMSASPVAVYSVRKLVSTYSGYCIKVRRSSDNNEVDVAFDVNGLVSANSAVSPTTWGSTFSAFYGSVSAYIVTCYDQTSNGYNATQSTTSNQPRIVNAGTLDVDANSKPAPTYSSYGLKATGATWSQPNTFCTVAQYSSTSSTNSKIFDSNTNTGRNMVANNNNTLSMFAGSTVNVGTTSTNQNIRTFLFNTTNSKYFENGTQQGTTYNPSTQSCDGITIGSAYNRYDQGMVGTIQEILIFNSALSDTDRRLLETDQADYYGITVANRLNTKTLIATVKTIASMVRNATIAGGGTTYTKALTASIKIVNATSRLTQKIFTAYVRTNEVIQKAIAKTFTAIVKMSTTILKQSQKILTATVKAVSSMTRVLIFLKVLTATVKTNATASRVMSYVKHLTANIKTQVNFAKAITKTFTARIGIDSNILKNISKIFTATIDVVSSFSKLFPKTLTATINIVNTMLYGRLFTKVLTATVGILNSLSKNATIAPIIVPIRDYVYGKERKARGKANFEITKGENVTWQKIIKKINWRR